jgi:hypothetical protein
VRSRLLRGVAAATLVVGVTGCASAAQLTPKLEKVAIGVPVPTGVTLVDVSRQIVVKNPDDTMTVDIGVAVANDCSTCSVGVQSEPQL